MESNLDDPNQLTEFAPLPSEEKQQGVGQFFSRLFKFGKNVVYGENTLVQGDVSPSCSSSVDTSPTVDNSDDTVSQASSKFGNDQLPIDVIEGRSFENVLKRIGDLLALKNTNLQAYSDTELRQYWMPDSVSKECYECSERFTTWRRRHHCRLCGQIFCSRCCSQEIPGRIMGCTGNLRVCIYCFRIVLSYLPTSKLEGDLSTDLKLLHEDLKSKIGSLNTSDLLEASTMFSSSMGSNTTLNSIGNDLDTTTKRKVSVGYQEEKFAMRGNSDIAQYNEDRARALQNSRSLRALYDEICEVTSGGNTLATNNSLQLASYRYRLRTYNNCFPGSQLVDWLINHNKAASRVQATALGQALLEVGYLENVVIESPINFPSNQPSFSDSLTRLYRPCPPSSLKFEPDYFNDSQNKRRSTQEPAEPVWAQQIPQDGGGTTTDSEAESQTCHPSAGTRLPSSSSSFYLDLDLGANTVHLVRPGSITPNDDQKILDPSDDSQNDNLNSEISVVNSNIEHEIVPKSGWFNLKQLREEYGESGAYLTLNKAWSQHRTALLYQLLNAYGLDENWAQIIEPLIDEVIEVVRPDMYHDAEVMDIREYVRVKTVPGERFERNECCVVRGIVCSKNVAHKCMIGERLNPQILLMACSLVYQRNEGKLMSLEPVLMQEHEYLRNATARILAMKPDIVLVGRNASRLAQQLLGEAGVVLVNTVKTSIMERLARASKAELVPSIDAANVGRRSWKLATCQKFYTKQLKDDQNRTKTLMFFEGLPLGHLACTILLRGGSKMELKKLKRVTLWMLYASYNWRLENSFLMDEFAKPPSLKLDLFLSESKESNLMIEKKLNDSNENKKSVVGTKKNSSDNQMTDSTLSSSSHKTETEKVEFFVDPLQCAEDEVFCDNETQRLTVTEIPLANRFRKALDGTILSISPYLTFAIPFLETEIGRHCKLRKFFPPEMYYSNQFSEDTTKIISNVSTPSTVSRDDYYMNLENISLKSQHPFITAKLKSSVNSNEVQSLLAHFRACGGRLNHQKIVCKPNNSENFKNETNIEANTNETGQTIDALDIENHQRLAVLFCSFSQESNNSPAFCVNPWIVNMHFYGKNDISLGAFLERYCFRDSYKCQSPTCDTPMLKHIRRFVHHNGCVTVILNRLDTKLSTDDERIVIWSWCTKCNTMSPIVPMSTDTWSFSFAKFLEYKVHGYMYGRRDKEDICTHSLHHDHVQYFGLNNIAVSFQYNPVEVWELYLPPPRIQFEYDLKTQHDTIINEIKKYALKGHELYSAVLDKFMSLSGDITEMKQLLQTDQMGFKMKIDQIQLKLTSKNENNSHQDNLLFIWQLEDAIINIKFMIAETYDLWNSRICEEIQNHARILKTQNSKQAIVSNTVLTKPSSIALEETPVDGMIMDSPTSPDCNVLDVANALTTDTTEVKGEDINVNDVPESPKTHNRTQSEGTTAVVQQDKDKRIVKTIISHFLTPTTDANFIPSPFSLQEHYIPNSGKTIPLTVFETEPSSIIAFALTTLEYRKSLDELCSKGTKTSVIQGNETKASPVHKRKVLNSTENTSELTASLDSRTLNVQGDDSTVTDGEKKLDPVNQSPHIDVQFQDVKANFLCRVHWAKQFSTLRRAILQTEDNNSTNIQSSSYAGCEQWEERYIRSLSRSIPWVAKGGKSGSFFCKTKDERFILKEMSKNEMDKFLEFAPKYFEYIHKCLTTSQPTLLGKIVGVYRVCYRTANASEKKNFLIMENLFYKRPVTHKFDLKGSMRNRHVNSDGQDSEIVLLDENLLKMTCKSPLYILPHSKAVLTVAIKNDTEFLAAQEVMDYSLLVGLDPTNKELVVGIIDYIRTFTWDKKLETMVKKSGILGGQGKLPTIISPDEYKSRFIAAMHRYFLPIPGRWSGLGYTIDGTYN